MEPCGTPQGRDAGAEQWSPVITAKDPVGEVGPKPVATYINMVRWPSYEDCMVSCIKSCCEVQQHQHSDIPNILCEGNVIIHL